MKTIKNVIWYFLSFIVMLVFPFLAVHFVKGDNGMAVFFILFYVLNPMYSIISGIVAGINRKSLRTLPLINTILFLIGSVCIVGSTDWSFSYFALAYLLIGYFFISIGMYINKKSSKEE